MDGTAGDFHGAVEPLFKVVLVPWGIDHLLFGEHIDRFGELFFSVGNFIINFVLVPFFIKTLLSFRDKAKHTPVTTMAPVLKPAGTFLALLAKRSSDLETYFQG